MCNTSDMTQPAYIPQPPPPPIPKTAKTKRFGFLALTLVGLSALLVGSAVGALSDSDDPTAGKPIATATATVTKTAQASADPVPEPEPEPTTDTYTPKKSDFVVKVKITDKQCFGSAGCSIDYKITPQYAGSGELPDTGVIEVTFEILGDEDPITGSFTVEGGQVEYDKEGFMSTPRSSTKVTSKITDVEYDPEG